MVITQNISLFSQVCRFLNTQNIESYLVGGIIRDLLIGRETVDIDIAVKGDALKIASQLASVIRGTYIPLDEMNQIGRVVINEVEKCWTFDFSTLRGSIERDLHERDFTINALAIDIGSIPETFTSIDKDLLNLPIIDPFQGQSDIQRGIIRAITSFVFKADPVRLLRAVRLKAELNLAIDPDTEKNIKNDAQLITNVAGERIREELVRLSAVPGSGALFTYLDELGLLSHIFPELIPARDTTQPVEHVWNVLEHSLNTVVALDFLLHWGEWPYSRWDLLSGVPWSDELKIHFLGKIGYGTTRYVLLKLAALLHDNAKPQTKAPTPEGRVRFLGHDREGSITAVKILERIRFSTREIRFVERCIRYHMRPTQLTHEELPSRRALYRYFRDTGDLAVDILFLSLADHLAARGPQLDPVAWREHVKLVEFVYTRYYNTEEIIIPPKLIDGHDLINIFGLKPGSLIGELLELVREAHAAGEISSREEAFNYIRDILKDRTGK